MPYYRFHFVLLLMLLMAGPVVATPLVLDRLDVRWALDLHGATDNLWQTYDLDDLSRIARPFDHGYEWYRFTFDAPEDITELVAFRFDRIGQVRRITLNDVLIFDGGSQRPFFHVRGFVSRFIEVPASLLTETHNLLEIEKYFTPSSRRGMSSVLVGPAKSLMPGYRQYLFFIDDLRTTINIAALVFGLLMLQIWFARPTEKAVGIFALFCVLNSVRTFLYFSEMVWVTSPVMDWFFFSVNCVTPLLLGLFGLTFAGRHQPGFIRAWTVIAITLPIAAAIALPFNQMGFIRLIGYPIIIAACIPAIAIFLQEAWRRGGRTLWALGLSLAFTVVAAIHDYLLSQGYMPIRDTFWLAYALPFIFLFFGAYLIGRLIKANNEVERLNLSLEDRVVDRTRKLEAANVAKTRFLASASHDLRQPIHTVSLLVGLLKAKASQPEIQNLVERISRAVSAMEDLLKGLLDLSRLDAGVVTPDFHAVRVNDVFEAIRSHLEPEADSNGLQLRFRKTSVVAHTDPVIFERMLRNLVANGLRYTRRGGVLVGVRRAGSGRFKIAVYDTGIGIPDDRKEEIFQEFYQIGNASRDRSKGLGLGLSIVQRCARLLDHPLTLRSVPGKGSCFCITVSGLSDDRSLRQVTAPTDVRALDLCNQRVAVVEDDISVRDSMQQLLEHLGATVFSASSGDALLAMLRRGDIYPDLIISDYRLHDESGLDVIREARMAFGDSLPALLVTGDTDRDDVMRIRRAGVPVLFKPFGINELREALAVLLGSD